MKLTNTTLCVALLSLAWGCSHAETVREPNTPAEANNEQQAASENADAQSNADADRRGGGSDPTQPAKDRTDTETERQRTGGSDAEDIPVATSAQGLLKPGAEDKVRAALGMKQGDRSMRNEIRRFQRQNNLPATGMLDQTTIEKLGLDPDEIFEEEEEAAD